MSLFKINHQRQGCAFNIRVGCIGWELCGFGFFSSRKYHWAFNLGFLEDIYIYVFFFFPLHQWFIPHDVPFSFTVKKAVFVALSSPVPEERIKGLSHSRDTCLLQVLLSLGSLTCNPAASGSISVCCFILNTTGKEEVSLFLICSVFVGLLFLC